MVILDLKQGEDAWRQARLEKVSGTRLGDAIGTTIKQNSLIDILVAEMLTGEAKEMVASLAMKLGTEAEDFGIQEYEELTGEITETIGLCVSEELPWLVCSPDRLIKRDGKYRKAVEVKSPNPETAVKYIRGDKIPKEYQAQVLNYFLVNPDLEELDFVVYSPKIQNQYRVWIKNITRQELEDEIVEATEKLKKFREKWEGVLQELNFSI